MTNVVSSPPLAVGFKATMATDTRTLSFPLGNLTTVSQTFGATEYTNHTLT